MVAGGEALGSSARWSLSSTGSPTRSGDGTPEPVRTWVPVLRGLKTPVVPVALVVAAVAIAMVVVAVVVVAVVVVLVVVVTA
jgi:hypothetical protein